MILPLNLIINQKPLIRGSIKNTMKLETLLRKGLTKFDTANTYLFGACDMACG